MKYYTFEQIKDINKGRDVADIEDVHTVIYGHCEWMEIGINPNREPELQYIVDTVYWTANPYSGGKYFEITKHLDLHEINDYLNG